MTVGGRALPRSAWRFVRENGVLEASFRLRRGTIRVTACGAGETFTG